jgi:hypothetical protein
VDIFILSAIFRIHTNSLEKIIETIIEQFVDWKKRTQMQF